MTTEDPISRARSLDSTADARELYSAWAPTYDRDVFERSGVTGSRRIAELFAAAVPDRSAAVIDLGCGTGAVGRHLAEVGFRDVWGIDLSPEMLALARATGAYRGLVVADLDACPLASGSFDGAVSAGTFTSGHVGGSAVPALLTTLRPGGVLAWTVATSAWPRIRAATEAHGVAVLAAESEAIRPGTDDEVVMLVARVG